MNLTDAVITWMVVLGIFLVMPFLTAGFFTAWLAGRKGYDRGQWFTLGLLFHSMALLTMIGAPVLRPTVTNDDIEREIRSRREDWPEE